MSILLDRRDDGSLAFFLDDDLQFDSRDEHIYHECLALPALALAEKRKESAITCLVLGGGDGLSLRELLKSDRVIKVDLVDYDASILQLARGEFSEFNNNSLNDPRTHVYIEDARTFVKRAAESGIGYDVIISDFTAPQTVEGAQLHSSEFYKSLAALLGDNGVLAANTVSPSGTPEAYWSIYNSVLVSDLNPRPYRIFLPSFAEQGYGADWGFIMASPKSITAAEIDNHLSFAEPRKALKDTDYLRQLFFFGQEDLQQQALSIPAAGTGEILVHYLLNPKPRECRASIIQDALAMDLSALRAPDPVTNSYVLPLEARNALGNPHFALTRKEDFIQSVMEMVPAVRRYQTREMIESFLEQPVRFLQSIDLEKLVDKLLKRASELPQKLVDELHNLRDKLVEFAGNYDGLLDVSMHVLAVICLVVVIGNLMYPDAVYAKGEHAGASAHAAGAGHGAGDRGARGGRNSFNAGGHFFHNNGGTWNGNTWGGGGVNTYTGTNRVIREPGTTIIQQPGVTRYVRTPGAGTPPAGKPNNQPGGPGSQH